MGGCALWSLDVLLLASSSCSRGAEGWLPAGAVCLGLAIVQNQMSLATECSAAPSSSSVMATEPRVAHCIFEAARSRHVARTQNAWAHWLGWQEHQGDSDPCSEDSVQSWTGSS